jgi:hypothetical protein
MREISIKNPSTMPSANPDDQLLLIRCPSCGQRFKVGEDLRGRTVECGACEHRFRINDEVVVRGKKFYPGERKDPSLNYFHRVPLAMASGTPAVPAVRYTEHPDPAGFEPPPPLRVIAAVVGAGGMVFMALLLILGASRGGILDGMTTGNRLLMAGFTALLGVALLVYGNPRALRKALVFGLLLGIGLVSLPLFFTAGSVPLRAEREDVLTEPHKAPKVAETKVEAEPEGVAELRNLIGTRPLESEIARLAKAGGNLNAVGLWLRNLNEQNRLLIRDYILRTTGADPQSHYFPRGGGDFLMVVTGITQTLDEVANVAAPLGAVVKVYPEIQVVEVRVNNDSFVSGPIEKLSDKTHPAFYDLNKKELESIDLARVSSAVKRLADAEPKIYRSDITRKLIALLGEPWVDFKKDICNALAVWSELPGPAGEAALKEARKLQARGVEVPQEIIALIVKEKTPGLVTVLDELWSGNPTRWESLYGDVGPAAEATLIRRFPTTEGSLRHSAVRLLGRVGGTESIPLLESADAGADRELKILIKNAISSIRERAGQ